MKVILLIIAFCGTFVVTGQQVPIYTNYNFNLFGINPAVAGSQSCLDLRTGRRKQWVNIPSAPTSIYAGIHGSFGKKKYNFHGVGVYVESDDMKFPSGNRQVSLFSAYSISAAYAYHLKVNRNNMLSLGMSFGFTSIGSNLTTLQREVDVDPAIFATERTEMFPQVGIGLWYQNHERYIGFSIKNLVENKFQFGLDSRFRRHYYLTAGKSIPVDDKLFFKPSVNLRYVSGSPIAADLGLFFDYNDLFEFGASFRGGHGISGMAKVAVLKYITIGYAYDLTLNKLRLGGRNSHEFMLGIQACPRGQKKGIPCSAYD